MTNQIFNKEKTPQDDLRDLLKLVGHDNFDLADDSRYVKQGDVFVLSPVKNWQEFALTAYYKGAAILVIEESMMPIIPSTISKEKVFTVKNAKLFLAKIARFLYPKQPKWVWAVTGTNGKSSVVHFVSQLLNNDKVATIGTMGINSTKSLVLDNLPALTTLGAINFFKTLDAIATQGIDYLAFETSSHGLDQHRCEGVTLSAAAFTNLTQDHLDYHQNMEQYFIAKMKLFTDILSSSKPAVVNKNSFLFERIAKTIKQPIFSYAIEKTANLQAHNLRANNNGFLFDLLYQGINYQNLNLNCVGFFQLENLLCAMGLLLSNDWQIDDLLSRIPLIKTVAGRMELVAQHNAGKIYVDYAHTPDALKSALVALKQHTVGKLWLVFGCGGNRDQAKRPIMGEVANRYADHVIVTDDNPRFEAPQSIRQQIIGKFKQFLEISDRKAAIKYAINNLKENDVLLIAGKGHENGQSIQGKILNFNDKEEVIQLTQKCAIFPDKR